MQKESGFTSRIADFVVTGTSQLELLNSATVKKVLRTEKILLLTDTQIMYFSPYEGKILSYMEHTQIIASFFRLKLKGDQ